MAENKKNRLTLKKILPYRGIDLFMTPEGICVIFLGTQIHSSLSVVLLIDEIDRYWKLRLN